MIRQVGANGGKEIFWNSSYDKTGTAIPALVVIAF
jgi:hypothetical protein